MRRQTYCVGDFGQLDAIHWVRSQGHLQVRQMIGAGVGTLQCDVGASPIHGCMGKGDPLFLVVCAPITSLTHPSTPPIQSLEQVGGVASKFCYIDTRLSTL